MTASTQIQSLLDQATVACRAAQYKTAEQHIAQVIALAPNDPSIPARIASALIEARQFTAAVQYLSAGANRFPKDPMILTNLGAVEMHIERFDNAEDAFRRALAIDPKFTAALFNLGVLKHFGRQLDASEDSLRQALAIEPDAPDCLYYLAQVRRDLGDIPDAVACYDRAVALRPMAQDAQSGRLFTLLFADHIPWSEIAAQQIAWGKTYAPRSLARTNHRNDRNPDRKLRIGYISPFFHSHVNAQLIEPILRAHERQSFEIFAYCNAPAGKSHEAYLRSHVDHWKNCSAMNDSQTGEMIESDGIDILVDLTAHMPSSRPLLFARGHAPIQINYLAYPATTGIEAMTYRVTCPQLDPPGEVKSDEPEKLIRLPDTFWCYPNDRALEIGPAPSIRNGYVTFGCLNSFAKVRPACLRAWGRILSALPTSRLLVFVSGGTASSSVLTRMSQAGIDTSRVTLLDSKPLLAHLARFNEIDVSLDTFPYGGHTTTHDSLWMGVATVAMKGNAAVSRAGECILSHVALPDLVADSEESYVQLAIQLAKDEERRIALRRDLRERMRNSPLTDAKRFAHNLEAGYRLAWKRWCEGLPPDHIDVKQIAMTMNAQAKSLLDQALAAVRARQPQNAVNLFAAALAADPQSVELPNKIGGVLISVGALPAAQRILSDATNRFPNDAGTFSNLGTVSINLGQAEEAMRCWRRAIEIDPGFSGARFNLANLLKTTRQPDEAEQTLRELLSRDAKHSDAWHALGHIRRDLGDCSDAIGCFQRAIDINPHDQTAHSALLYSTLFDDRLSWHEVIARHVAWGNQLAPPAKSFANDRNPDRKLRLGYISPFYSNHVNTELSLPILAIHDRTQYEVFGYCTGPQHRVDGRTKSSVDHFRQVDSISDEELFATLQRDAIDVLIDLTSHMDASRMKTLARKPAPIQVNYLAYPATSGLTSIDYRVTCAPLDPLGSQDSLEPERLIRLADTYWCYPTHFAVPIAPPPSVRNGFVTFGCLNSFVKVRPTAIALWATILSRVPESKLVILVRGGENARSVRERLAREGIASSRLILADYVDRAKHLQRFNEIDVCLDSFPYGGHVTTHDALWMGRPVISLAGETPISRAGECILSLVGLGELVADSHERYIELAISLANDVGRREGLSQTLRNAMIASPICDVAKFTRALESGYRQAWKRFCAGLPPIDLYAGA